jgi:glycosyltransferase involved in cell wall biosynthesis
VSRIAGKQAYFNRFTTWLFLRRVSLLKPDVVHLHNLHSNYIQLNMLLRYLAKHDIPTIITMHDCWYYTGGCTHYTSLGCYQWKTGCGHCPQWKQLPSWFVDTTKTVLKDRSKYINAIPRLTIVGASSWIASEAESSVLKNKSICFIHNGFDLNIFRPRLSVKRDELGIKERFVVLGSAEKWTLPINKPTLDYFVDHMESNMIMVLFGNRPPSYSASLSKIIWLGYVKDRQEMAEIYSMADVFVNCSREDTLSSLNLECQACGTPVVTYEATGSKETVNGECSFSVETGNYEALWDMTMKVHDSGKEAFSGSCQSWIKTFFEKEVYYKKYIELYRKVTSA